MDPVRLLQEMVSIQSLTGDEGPLAEYIVGRMGELGYDEAFVDGAGNSVGIRRGETVNPKNQREIVLLGHMDTVPGDVPVRIEGDRLYGRGSVDAKGPLATFVLGCARVQPAPDTTLIVVGAVEEESATSRGARFVAPLYHPEACIIGEPSSWDAITVGYKGRILLDVRFEQAGGHSAGPVGSVAERVTNLWNDLTSFSDGYSNGSEKLFDQLMPSLRSFKTSSDGLTDVAEATIGFRLPPDFDSADLRAHTRALVGDARAEFYGEEPAWTSPRSTPIANAFTRAIRSHGGKARALHKTGTSDMNVLGPVWQCPFLAYGPGDSRLDHRPDEHVALSELRIAIDVLTDALVGAGYATRGQRPSLPCSCSTVSE